MPITLRPAPGTKERSCNPIGNFKYESITDITSNFSTLVGNFQFGNVYRGTYRDLEVVVKVWLDKAGCHNYRENRPRVQDEGYLFHRLLLHPNRPNLPHMIGYTSLDDRIAAAVYNIEPKDLLINLIHEESFSWSHRIRVALGLASVLEYFHYPEPPTLPYLIRNISAANILIDEGFNPFLFDFGMISGGIFPDRKDLLNQRSQGSDGYIDPSLRLGGGWSDKSDVFAYGVLLLCLITKRNGESLRKGGQSNEGPEESKMHLHEWAKTVYEKSGTLVDLSLVSDMLFIHGDGSRITKLALECVNDNPRKRPTMKKVVRLLMKLSIVQNHMEIVVTDGIIKGKTDEQFGIHGSMSRKSNQMHSFPRQHEQINPISQKMKKFFPASLLTSKSFKAPEQFKEVKELEIFTKDMMSSITNGFGDVIGRFQYGAVYNGMYGGRKMTVKVWEDGQDADGFVDRDGYNVRHYKNVNRLQDELVLLQHPKMVSHSGLVDIIGYCDDHDCLGVVYDLEPSDTVLNLLDKENFSWENRMKVALQFASLLEYLHTRDLPHPPYEVWNIDAAHIMLDKEYNPKLFDFSSIFGGIFPDKWRLHLRRPCEGYREPDDLRFGYLVYGWADIFAFGILLICLIAKRRTADETGMLLEPLIHEWAEQEIESASAEQKKRVSLVHESLRHEKGFFTSDGELLTQLAMKCVAYCPDQRPSMDVVVKKLRSLKIHKHCRTFKSQ